MLFLFSSVILPSENLAAQCLQLILYLDIRNPAEFLAGKPAKRQAGKPTELLAGKPCKKRHEVFFGRMSFGAYWPWGVQTKIFAKCFFWAVFLGFFYCGRICGL
jgi:hypothetical protein